ncbi:MAG TPA: ROK family protein [Afifellaceae bacterium]|nr:ROK family protein [Afifellaceae bacterium]
MTAVQSESARIGGSILVIDVGGNNVKFIVSGDQKRRKIPSGPDFTPEQLLAGITEQTGDRQYDRVSIGVPGVVKEDRIVIAPVNLGKGWTKFDFAAAFECPVKLVNDAVMQALGSYDGGAMLFLGLGTGLGAALVRDGLAAPLEVAHLPYRDEMTFEDFVGRRGLKRLGEKAWEAAVHDVVERLRLAMVADYVVLGGGNASRLKKLPDHASLGNNDNALIGGFRLWA